MISHVERTVLPEEDPTPIQISEAITKQLKAANHRVNQLSKFNELPPLLQSVPSQLVLSKTSAIRYIIIAETQGLETNFALRLTFNSPKGDVNVNIQPSKDSKIPNVTCSIPKNYSEYTLYVADAMLSSVSEYLNQDLSDITVQFEE